MTERTRRLGDLLIAYSKRLDLLSELVSAVEHVRVGDGEEPETGLYRAKTRHLGW